MSLRSTTTLRRLFSLSTSLQPLVLLSKSLRSLTFSYSSQKSTTQKAGDSLRGNTDDAKDESKGIAAQVSDSVSSGIQNAKEAVTGNKQ